MESADLVSDGTCGKMGKEVTAARSISPVDYLLSKITSPTIRNTNTSFTWSSIFRHVNLQMFSTVIEIEIHVKKRGQKSQKVFFMKFAGQSEMFSLKNRRTQSLFLKNMFSIKKMSVMNSTHTGLG